MKEDKLRVPVEKLRYNCNPADLDLEPTTEPLKTFIGQKRAIKSLEFGLRISTPGYHIFAAGLHDTGRNSLIHKYLQEVAKERKNKNQLNLKDICYIYNFDDSSKPKVLILDQGDGKKFQAEIAELFIVLAKTIPAILESQEYLEKRNEIEARYNHEIIKLGRELEEKSEEFTSLPKDSRQQITKNKEIFQQLLEKNFLKAKQLKEKKAEELEELEKMIINQVIKTAFGKLNYKNETINNYLEGLKDYILENIDLFKPKEETCLDRPLQGIGNQIDPFLPFKINLLVDNGEKDSPPIIFDNNPTFVNLFGRIEKGVIRGGYYTNHTLIKPGSLLMANGGYLVVNVLDLLINIGVWQRLKNILAAGSLQIENLAEYLGYSESITLQPESIPIDLKVIVIGQPYIYNLLIEYDDDFLSIFKVKAEFDHQMWQNKQNLINYIRFIQLCCQKENLLPIEKGAVAKIIEYGVRLTDDKKKLSTQFGKIKDLIIESNYWAGQRRGKKIETSDVTRAIEEKRQRVSLLEEKYQEYVHRGIFLIETRGEKVGQVNGLAVYGSEDFSFGLPGKITAETFLGEKGVISIQREVKLAGPIHNTGVLILSGYLGAKYAQNKILSLSASLCFEQSYGQIEGDSASAAELLALISSLSGLPINQSLAITGSMNQKGEIQPIGGVNQKIEGFFDACKKKGLTGKQGVIIPIQNIDNLMLREDVVKAVADGKFHIYAIKTVDQGLELLTGYPSKGVHQLVDQRLKKWSKISQKKGVR